MPYILQGDVQGSKLMLWCKKFAQNVVNEEHLDYSPKH